MKKCSKCLAANKDSSIFCTECGNNLTSSLPVCPYCNEELRPGDKFCRYCGKEINQPEVTGVFETPEEFVPKRDKLKISLVVISSIFGFVILALAGIFLARYLIENNTISTIYDEISGERENTTKAELGHDQERVIKLFGYPDQFLILFDEGNNNRIDTWTYSEMETIFIFENGNYASTEEYYKKVILDDKQKVFPDDFIYAMTPDEVETLI